MFATNNDSIVRTVAGTIGTLIFASACLIAAAGPASAADAPRTGVVHYSDLDLAHPAGRTALDYRIKAAARALCATGLADVRARNAEARCVRQAVNSAHQDVAAAVPADLG